MNKFYICALGCKVNSYEIDAIKDDLISQGLTLSTETEADIVIVNTCCVTNTAASKSRQKINSIHKNNPLADIIVMGCYVQGFEQEVKGIDGVKLLVGTKDRHKIKDYVNDLKTQISLVEDIKETAYFLPTSNTSKNAFVVKYSDRSHDEISKRLVRSSLQTIEHIHPESDGGENNISNFMLASASVNNLRGNMPFKKFIKRY